MLVNVHTTYRRWSNVWIQYSVPSFRISTFHYSHFEFLLKNGFSALYLNYGWLCFQFYIFCFISCLDMASQSWDISPLFEFLHRNVSKGYAWFVLKWGLNFTFMLHTFPDMESQNLSVGSPLRSLAWKCVLHLCLNVLLCFISSRDTIESLWGRPAQR